MDALLREARPIAIAPDGLGTDVGTGSSELLAHATLRLVKMGHIERSGAGLYKNISRNT
jgi:hypothetical protein